MQRVKIDASVRRKAQAEMVADYLAGVLRESGAGDVDARGAGRRRGGRVQVVADAADAVAVMRSARQRLDGDENGYAADVLDEMRVSAFESADGGMLGFAAEDYRVVRAG